jgi:RNA polymerase sigma-70 factor, ECF subfamily
LTDAKKPNPGDWEVVAAMASGDTEALHILTSRYGGMLAALARRFGASEEDAEEIAADVLWQAWREAGAFERARGSVTAWLVTLGRSRAIDRLRANRVHGRLIRTDPGPGPVSEPAAEFELTERASIVRNALAQLDSSERVALELAYFSDLSQSQIAQKLGIPLGTAKTRIRSAMIKLRKALSGAVS